MGLGMAFAFRCADALFGLMDGKEAEVRMWLPDCFRMERFRLDNEDLKVKAEAKL